MKHSVLLLLVLIDAGLVESTQLWMPRHVTLTPVDNRKNFKLRLCAVKESDMRCRDIKYSTAMKNHCTLVQSCNYSSQVLDSEDINCIDVPNGCGEVSQFHEAWLNKTSTCKCYAMSRNNAKNLMTTTSSSQTGCSSTVPSQLVSEDATKTTALAVIVVLLVVLLAAVTTGWVWTCWVMKKLRRGIESSCMQETCRKKTIVDSSECHLHNTLYENSTHGHDISMTTLQSSTAYSLLRPDNETILAADGEDVLEGGYNVLDRSRERSKLNKGLMKARRKGETEGYSALDFEKYP